MFMQKWFSPSAAHAPDQAVAGVATASHPELVSQKGLALSGHDAVGYFLQAAPMQGHARHQVRWNGADWHFHSAETRAAFEASPEAYAPRYGGYCAFSLSRGVLAEASPKVWMIHDGALYLGKSADLCRDWRQDLDGNIARADANWPRLLSA